MKDIILLSIIILFSCAKASMEDELVITNTLEKAVECRINGQKSWTILQPDENVSFFVSGVTEIQLLRNNTVVVEDMVFVEGLVYWP